MVYIVNVERENQKPKTEKLRMAKQVQIDHSAYQRKVKRMTDAALLFTIRDAKSAIHYNPDGHKSGYYADEIHYCASERFRRCT